MIEVAFANGFSFGDGAVKNGLSEGRFVAFVVAEAAIAIHIDDDVALEFVGGNPMARRTTCATASGSSPVHVKNSRSATILATSVAYWGGTRFRWGPVVKTDLIVHHDVQGAADGVAGKLC